MVEITNPSAATLSGPPLVRAAWAHRWFLLVALIVAGGAAWQGARALLGPAIVVDRVARGALTETVVATGNVQTPYRVEIGSQITGTVQDVLVEEGQRVVKGQPLIRIEDSELKSAVVGAEGAVEQAEARMRQLADFTLPTARETLAQMRAALVNAQQTFDRTADLVKTGSGTRVALDDAQKTLDVARAQSRAAELAVFTSSPGGSDYVLAQTQLRQAQAALEIAKARLEYANISAPRDGVLLTRSVERGSVVQPGKALLVLAPDGEMQLDLQIDERNLGRILLGEKAIASADAFPDRKFPANVSYINPGVDIARATVEVKLTVPNPPDYLRQDMTVSVDIAYAHRDDTLVLPARSVHDALTDAPWLLGVRDGRAYKQEVKLGLRGQTQIEILDGAREGDAVVPANSGLVTGQRLRPIFR